MYITEMTLDLNAENNKKYYFAKQGDSNTRAFKIALTADGTPYTGDLGTILFRVEKADRHGVIVASSDVDPVVLIQDDGTILVTLTSQMLAVPGRAICDLELLDSGGCSVSTMTFYLFVMPSPNIANQAVSSDDFKTLHDLIAKAEGGGVVVDTVVSETSPNPVQNKAIYKFVTNKIAEIEPEKVTVDTAVSNASVNPVQNKAIYKFVKTELEPYVTKEYVDELIGDIDAVLEELV